jgi:hypothetical protein
MISSPQATVVFRMNGVGGAFLRELGCHPCPQCSATKPRANTSGSLLVLDRHRSRHRLRHHLLFDCGAGVVESLIDYGVTEVHQILISHRHPDHNLDLDRLINSLRRSGATPPFDCYCTAGTWQGGPAALFPWLPLRHRPVTPGQAVSLFPSGRGDGAPPGDLGIGLRITPLSVWHGLTAPDAAIWVIEFGRKDDSSYRKIVLAWDLLHLVPAYRSEDRDSSYAGPRVDSDDLTEEHARLLKGADELFLEATSCLPRPDSGHTSLAAALRFYIPALQPRQTWIVHYSGHSDPWGPLSDDDLQGWLDLEKQKTPAAGMEVRVARHGMTRTWTV